MICWLEAVGILAGGILLAHFLGWLISRTWGADDGYFVDGLMGLCVMTAIASGLYLLLITVAEIKKAICA